MVSQSVIITMLLGLIFCVLLPVVSVIYFKIKTHFMMKTVFIGVLGYFLFAMVFEQILHVVIIPGIIKENTLAFALYGAMAAGVFEEVGRFLMFKLFLKDNREWKDGLGYGIGHAGIETLWIGAFAYLSNLMIALAINSGAINNLTAGQNDFIEATKESLVNSTAYLASQGSIARLLAFVVQIALSLLILYAIRQRKYIYLLLAIFIHASIDFIPALYQIKVITNEHLGGAVMLVFAVISVVFIFKSKPFFSNPPDFS